MSDTELDQEVDLQALAEQGQEAEFKQDDKQGEELTELSDFEQKAFDQCLIPELDFNGTSEIWKTPNEYIQDV